MINIVQILKDRRNKVSWKELEKALNVYGDEFYENVAFFMYRSVYPGICKFNKYKKASDLKRAREKDFERWTEAAKSFHSEYRELVKKEENQ